MKTYLTKQTVLSKYGITEDELNSLCNIKTALLNNNEIIFSEDDLRNHLARRIDKEQFATLENESILLSEAAQKYKFKIGSLARWVTAGHIRIVTTEGNYRIFLNESDVAYARALADIRGIRSGRSLFPRKKKG